MRKEKHAPPFFRATSGIARFGKQFGCGHTPKFSQAAGPQKCLLGSSPTSSVRAFVATEALLAGTMSSMKQK